MNGLNIVPEDKGKPQSADRAWSVGPRDGLAARTALRSTKLSAVPSGLVLFPGRSEPISFNFEHTSLDNLQHCPIPASPWLGLPRPWVHHRPIKSTGTPLRHTLCSTFRREMRGVSGGGGGAPPGLPVAPLIATFSTAGLCGSAPSRPSACPQTGYPQPPGAPHLGVMAWLELCVPFRGATNRFLLTNGQ